MTADLGALYERAVLDHSRHPRNRRAIEGGHRGEEHNPMCGDRIAVYVRLEGDVIHDASFEGSACAIAIAAASLMTEVVTGRTTTDARATFDRFRLLIAQPSDAAFDEMGPLAALAGVRQFPIRVKCACLPWQALQRAIDAARQAARV